MPGINSFVKIKSEVAEPERTETYGPGKSGARAKFDPKHGVITLIGLPGSGRRSLAALLAKRLNMAMRAPEAESGALLAALSPERAPGAEARGVVLVLGPEHLTLKITGAGESESAAALLKSKSKVFWLMAEPLKLARINQVPMPEAEAWISRAVKSEELFYSALHFILPADKNSNELLQNILEIIAY